MGHHLEAWGWVCIWGAEGPGRPPPPPPRNAPSPGARLHPTSPSCEFILIYFFGCGFLGKGLHVARSSSWPPCVGPGVRCVCLLCF